MTELLEQPDSVPLPNASLGDGVALVRRVLAEAATEPRWPMYPRQFKQFLRTAQPDFDERKYGSIADLMRACQKDGLLRLERDRQGALRVFGGGYAARRGAARMGLVAPRERIGSRRSGFGPRRRTAVVDVVPEVIAAPDRRRADHRRSSRTAVEAKAKARREARKTAATERPTAKKASAAKAPRHPGTVGAL